MSVRTGGLAFLAVVLISARPVRADLVSDAPASARSALRLSRSVFGYFATVGGNQSWVQQEIRRIRYSHPGLTTFARRPRRTELASKRAATPQPAAITSQGGPAGRYVAGGGEGGESFAGSGGSALPSLAAINEELMAEAIKDIPDAAFSMADTLMNFSDGTMQLVLNLRSILARTNKFDWTAIFAGRRALQSDRSKKAHEHWERRRKEKKSEDAVQRRRIKKVVRSVFKILFGVALGWVLWLVVRRS